MGTLAAGLLLTPMVTAMAQTTSPLNTDVNSPSAPAGYLLHESIDVGGHMANITGSGAMYDTLVNLHSGPRVMGDTFTLEPLTTNKHPLFDHLTVFSTGFGGDPYNYASMDFDKGKYYEFAGTFRRDRQYFDYDLLGNPNLASGQSIPVGPSNSPTGAFSWPQVEDSPFLYNTVRRMTDVNLTLFPVSRLTYHIEYSQDIFQGPSLSPGGQLAQSDLLLEDYQRNSTDYFRGEVDWKPVRDTQLTYEQIVDHYKEDSYYTIAASQFLVQEADGTQAALGDWDSQTPYGINYCNNGSMGNAPYTILNAAQTPGGKPVINAACDVFTSYLRSQPTRILYPTEVFRFQSSSIKNIAINGDLRYTQANMNLPKYYENFQGLDGKVRSATWTGSASAKRKVLAADYAFEWNPNGKIGLSDDGNFSSVQQPGSANVSAGSTLDTPGNPDQTITYTGTLTPGADLTVEGNPNGKPQYGFFGQKRFTNNATLTWNGLSRATLSVTYRYGYHVIAQGIPHSAPLAVGSLTNGTVTIHENGGIFTVALRPAANWNVNGSAAVFYSDNAFTPVEPRQLQQYQLHTMYRAKSWLALNATYNDREIHNNTNNQQAAFAAGNVKYAGPIDHVAYSRVLGVGATVIPNEYYNVSFNYGFSDVYTSTNICYDAAASSTLPGAATQSGTACPGATVRGTSYYEFGPTKDFESSPTQYGTVSLNLQPVKRLRSTLAYNVSSVDGSRFYNDARDVAGSLVSTYQSPYVNVAWTVRKGWIWSAEYKYYGYGEGGPSGAQYCSTTNPTPSSPAAVIPCNSTALAGLQTGMTISPAGETSPRNFHANVVTLGMHYEF
jgi:hypothetical protein